MLDVAGRVVAPGFIDPHGHSDGSLFVDGALASHLHQGYTTQLSGNCGDTLAPLTARGREIVELSLRPNGLDRALADVRGVPRRGRGAAARPERGVPRRARDGPRRRSSGAEARPPTPDELAAMVARGRGGHGRRRDRPVVGADLRARDARRGRPRSRRWSRRRRAAAACTRPTCATSPTACSRRSTSRSPRSGPPAPAARLQVSHLKCGSRAVWGRAGEAVARLEAARADGLDVAADQYPYTAAATTLATILPPALQGLGVDACVAALADPRRPRPRPCRDRARHLGLGERGRRPGLGRASGSRSRRAIRTGPAARSRSSADELHADPADLAFDALVDDRLDVSIVIDCMDEADVETIMAVPWIAVCTDAEGRRPGHPILDAGGRTRGPTAARRGCSGTYVRERGVLSLETAVAKLTSVPAARLGLRDRGVVREGAFADLVVFDPATVADVATYTDPARYPTGIDHVIVNGRPAILDGAETGERPGRLLRRS